MPLSQVVYGIDSVEFELVGLTLQQIAARRSLTHSLWLVRERRAEAKFNTLDEYADHLNQLEEQLVNRKQIADMGYKTKEQYDPEKAASSWLAIWQDTVDRGVVHYRSNQPWSIIDAFKERVGFAVDETDSDKLEKEAEEIAAMAKEVPAVKSLWIAQGKRETDRKLGDLKDEGVDAIDVYTSLTPSNAIPTDWLEQWAKCKSQATARAIQNVTKSSQDRITDIILINGDHILPES